MLGLAGRRTTARLFDDGSHYVLNGAKTFIAGGVHADRVIVCARTSAPLESNRRFGISLLAVDTKSEGYQVGRKLDKLGLRTSDTVELVRGLVRRGLYAQLDSHPGGPFRTPRLGHMSPAAYGKTELG